MYDNFGELIAPWIMPICFCIFFSYIALYMMVKKAVKDVIEEMGIVKEQVDTSIPDEATERKEKSE